MSRPCCAKMQGLKIINVDGMEVGLIGLDNIFLEVYLSGVEDEDILKEELFKKVREKNYMSEKLKSQYATALLREYKAFCARQTVALKEKKLLNAKEKGNTEKKDEKKSFFGAFFNLLRKQKRRNNK